MVEMGVDEEEFPAVPVAQHDPCGDSLAGAVPSQRPHHFGGLAQPERSRIEQREAVLPEEHGAVFARLGAVQPSDAHSLIPGQQTAQIIELVGKQLLRAQHVDLLRLNHPGDPFAAETPVVLPVFGMLKVITLSEVAEPQAVNATAARR